MKKFIILFTLLASPVFAQNVVYYNPAVGNDKNSGTKLSPLRTYEAASKKLIGAGQIISPQGVTTYSGARRNTPVGPK